MDELLNLNIVIEKCDSDYEVYWGEDHEGTFSTLKEAKVRVLDILKSYARALAKDILNG